MFGQDSLADKIHKELDGQARLFIFPKGISELMRKVVIKMPGKQGQKKRESQRGKEGDEATEEKYGPEFHSEIGRKGEERRGGQSPAPGGMTDGLEDM